MPRRHKGLVMSEDTILAAIAALDVKLTTFDARLTTFRVDALARFDRVENRLTA
jgi:hypothetical protein